VDVLLVQPPLNGCADPLDQRLPLVLCENPEDVVFEVEPHIGPGFELEPIERTPQMLLECPTELGPLLHTQLIVCHGLQVRLILLEREALTCHQMDSDVLTMGRNQHRAPDHPRSEDTLERLGLPTDLELRRPHVVVREPAVVELATLYQIRAFH
jgi:hypothetical protein